jgi:TonB family protein
MTQVWTKWEGQIINGVFPLRRFLSDSDHSAVFLTEFKEQDLPNAAIKFVAADSPSAEELLSHWMTAVSLSHPHLLRLLDAGHCRLGGRHYIFVVMEYAGETLSELLPHRSLTPDEMREMLLPTLEALRFLHGKNLVQGQLKPSNFLVVDDQLKLASDTIRPAGHTTAGMAELSPYDPPEAPTVGLSAASDVWGLGVTMVEALTQSPPTWPNGRSEAPSLPANLPAAFADIVGRCLSRNPADRPTTSALKTQLTQPPQSPPLPLPQAASRGTASQIAKLPAKRRSYFVPIATLVVLAALWLGWRTMQTRSDLQRQQAIVSPTAIPEAATSAAPPQSPQAPASPEVTAPSPGANLAGAKPAPPASAMRPSDLAKLPSAPGSSFVLHEQIPAVPPSARATIQGHIKVSVHVTIDRSGNVGAAALENPGSSKYFARLATEAARKWKFAAAPEQSSREGLLQFEFTRDGATAHAVTPRP